MIENKKSDLVVCFFGTYRKNYVRNKLNIKRLRNQGIKVIECHSTLWMGDKDRQNSIEGNWKKIDFWKRVFSSYIKLIKKHRTINHYDVMVLGYPGQFDIFLARILTWFRKKPLAWDVLMSLHLIALERELDKNNRFIVNVLHHIEIFALRLPDLIFIDTNEYSKWFQECYKVDPEIIRILPLGANDFVFQPHADQQPNNNKFWVLYYGSFIPNHNVLTIAKTARLLSNHKDIHFQLFGEGPEKDIVRKFVKTNELSNINIYGWLSYEKLVIRISHSDIILGVFGTTDQSLMTVQNKIWEGLAMCKPVITGDSKAVRAIFKHQKHLFLCDRSNPNAIADAILTLKTNANLRNEIQRQGYQFYKQKYSSEVIGDLLSDFLFELVITKNANS